MRADSSTAEWPTYLCCLSSGPFGSVSSCGTRNTESWHHADPAFALCESNKLFDSIWARCLPTSWISGVVCRPSSCSWDRHGPVTNHTAFWRMLDKFYFDNSTKGYFTCLLTVSVLKEILLWSPVCDMKPVKLYLLINTKGQRSKNVVRLAICALIQNFLFWFPVKLTYLNRVTSL